MNKKLYVGNLSYEVTADDLRDLFSAYGEVAEVKIITNRDPANPRGVGSPRGFAFVTMESSDAASKAIDALHGQPFRGRNLTVNLAREEPRDRMPSSRPSFRR